ncbi:MAG: hypothetical protein IKG17_09900 [Mogibacterium sp.]|nr:hypothetical protein [Mogibacterium sp.]
MRKAIIFVLCLLLAFTVAACSKTSSVTTDEEEGFGYSRVMAELTFQANQDDEAFFKR